MNNIFNPVVYIEHNSNNSKYIFVIFNQLRKDKIMSFRI
jgi:hypothetical protein